MPCQYCRERLSSAGPKPDYLGYVRNLPKVVWPGAARVAVNLQTSFLTPPFGFALFYLKGVAPPEVTLQQLYRGIIPFVVLQLIGLGLTVVFPELVTWLPAQIFD